MVTLKHVHANSSQLTGLSYQFLPNGLWGSFQACITLWLDPNLLGQQTLNHRDQIPSSKPWRWGKRPCLGPCLREISASEGEWGKSKINYWRQVHCSTSGKWLTHFQVQKSPYCKPQRIFKEKKRKRKKKKIKKEKPRTKIGRATCRERVRQ